MLPARGVDAFFRLWWRISYLAAPCFCFCCAACGPPLFGAGLTQQCLVLVFHETRRRRYTDDRSTGRVSLKKYVRISKSICYPPSPPSPPSCISSSPRLLKKLFGERLCGSLELAQDPAERLGERKGVGEIKHHPFFGSVHWALIANSTAPFVVSGPETPGWAASMACAPEGNPDDRMANWTWIVSGTAACTSVMGAMMGVGTV